jgi:hypothetical protein
MSKPPESAVPQGMRPDTHPIRKGREPWGRVHLLADASAPFEPRFVSQRPFWVPDFELKRVRRGWRFW